MKEMQKNNPLVSVVISTYNRSDLIKETITSILNQTYTNLELIIVDDGSKDNTEEVVRSIKDIRINYIKTENWGGPARPRNIGIKNAKGEYVAFCDDDDLWMPEKLETQLKQFKKNKIIGVGTSALFIGDNHFKRVKYINSDILLDFKKILSGNNVTFSSLMVRNLGFYFDENEIFKFVEDYDFQVNITLKTQLCIKLLKEPLVKYRIFLNKDLAKDERAFNVLEKYRDYLSPKEINQITHIKYFALGITALKQGSKKRFYFLKKSYEFSNSFREKLNIIPKIILAYMPQSILLRILKIYYNLRK